MLVSTAFLTCDGQNPFIRHMYTADPSAHVFEGSVYVYPSHDRDSSVAFDMVDYHVFSSENLVDWTDHGVVLSLDEVSWASENAWAPDCVFYNGKYYLSYSTWGERGVTGPQIVYATSDHVLGPYEYQGVILDEVNSGTNHRSIVEYKGDWYLFYHNSDLFLEKTPEDSPDMKYRPFRRSICVDRLYYNEDGSIRKVIPTKKGVAID